MKLLFTADVHLCSAFGAEDSVTRNRELLAVFKSIIEDGVKQGVDALILGGDLFDTPAPDEITASLVKSIIENSGIPTYAIAGVTTNPTILSKEGGDVLKLLKDIRAIIGDKELHVQVTETEADKMVEEAEAIVNYLGKNTFVKIPATPAGLKATKILSDKGIGITVTAVLTAAQAMLASNSGAAYVAPYVSRLENICADGVGTVAEIAEIFSMSGTDTQILAASFKTAKQVLDCAVVGCHTATVGTEVMHKLIQHTTTDTSIEGFANDWKKAFGDVTLLKLIKG